MMKIWVCKHLDSGGLATLIATEESRTYPLLTINVICHHTYKISEKFIQTNV